MTRYYIGDRTAPNGVIELTHAEWLALFGTDETEPYASKVYRGEMTIDEVPEDIRAEVQGVVDNQVSRFGLYAERNIPDGEALSIILGGDEA